MRHRRQEEARADPFADHERQDPPDDATVRAPLTRLCRDQPPGALVFGLNFGELSASLVSAANGFGLSSGDLTTDALRGRRRDKPFRSPWCGRPRYSARMEDPRFNRQAVKSPMPPVTWQPSISERAVLHRKKNRRWRTRTSSSHPGKHVVSWSCVLSFAGDCRDGRRRVARMSTRTGLFPTPMLTTFPRTLSMSPKHRAQDHRFRDLRFCTRLGGNT